MKTTPWGMGRKGVRVSGDQVGGCSSEAVVKSWCPGLEMVGTQGWKQEVKGICSPGNRRGAVSKIRKRETIQLKTGKEYEQGMCRKGNQSGQ